MTSPTAIQDRYPEALQHCYGCGALNEAGMQLKSFESGDRVVAEFRPDGKYQGIPGYAYGGLIASLIDCHAMAAAAAAFGDGPAGQLPRTVTANLEVRFLKPTPLTGAPLVLEAVISEKSERKAVVEVDLSVAGERTAAGTVVAVRLPDSMSS